MRQPRKYLYVLVDSYGNTFGWFTSRSIAKNSRLVGDRVFKYVLDPIPVEGVKK